jgi:signal transduction histidine kinase
MPDLLGDSTPLTHACIPLQFERGVLGVMNIADRPGQVFTPEELHFMETAARQICFTVDKAQTTRAERRRNLEAQALSSLAKAIGGSLDLEQVLAAIGERARELLSADRCVIYLGADPSRVEFAYLSGPPLEGLERGRTVDLVALGSKALVETLRQQRTMVITDSDRDDRVNAELARRWNSTSAIMVPLSARERPQGLLVADRQRPSVWKASEVDLAGALGGQAALAIENARLYRESREALLRLGKAQDSMMRSERMAAIGTLAAGLAHEVRNPLNSISLQLVLLARRLAKVTDGLLKSEVDSLVETTRREIERLDQLVGEFLSLSSVDRLSLKDSDPEALIHDVMDLMAPLARDRGVRVSENLSGRLPPIPLDREKMKQVLINLVRNAIEAMPDGGSLQLCSRASNATVVLGVTDSGPGIEPGLNVFDFFTTTKEGGTGLGLPIARSIIEAHGGDLTFESRPGQGSTFFVKLKVPTVRSA